MRSKALIIAFCLLAFAGGASAQEGAKRQLIVPLADGGFVAFKSETSWTDAKRSSTELQRGTSVLSSQAVMDDNHIIHRVLEDAAGRVIFGYDLLVAAKPSAKQFKIEVRPLDQQFGNRLQMEKANGPEPKQPEVVSTFPKPTQPQMLDDGDAFSLDLLVNQNAGVKIVDVVRVTFNRPSFDVNPRMMPRDFTLDAIELAMKDYRLLVDGNAIAAGKSANGVAGALLWFYVSDRGRFFFSLVPRAGYEFQKVGVVDENRIEFTVNGNHYEWLSSSPILPGGGVWNLWVLHDPNYAPIFGYDPTLPQKKTILQKVDDMVNLQPASRGIGSNQKRTTLEVVIPNQTSQTGATRRLRIMIGGADRIENLWPRDP